VQFLSAGVNAGGADNFSAFPGERAEGSSECKSRLVARSVTRAIPPPLNLVASLSVVTFRHAAATDIAPSLFRDPRKQMIMLDRCSDSLEHKRTHRRVNGVGRHAILLCTDCSG